MNASGSPRLAFSPTTAPPATSTSRADEPSRPTRMISRLRVGEVDQDEPVAGCPRVQQRVFGLGDHLLPADLSTVDERFKIDSDQPPGLGVQIRSKIEGGAVRAGQHEFGKRLVDDLDRAPELAALSRR